MSKCKNRQSFVDRDRMINVESLSLLVDQESTWKLAHVSRKLFPDTQLKMVSGRVTVFRKLFSI
jgi:hypothetical protein